MASKETAKGTTDGEPNGTERTLVVLDPERPGDTLRAALGTGGIADGEFDLLLVYSDAEYERRLDGRRQAGYRGPASVNQLAETAARAAARAGREWLGTADGYGTPYGDVGRLDRCVAHAIAERGYARVCAPLPRRTLLGRLLRRPATGGLVHSLPEGVELLTVPDRDTHDPGTAGLDPERRRVDE